jgi:TPR repeat protein
MYREGKGVQQSYAEALKWYRKAAEQGDVGAQNDLGLMYDEGQGVPQDYVIAHMWYTLAAAQGTLKEAVTNRDGVAARMTPAQIAEAQKLVRKWNASPHDWTPQPPAGQPRDFALSAPDQPLKMKFEIDCSKSRFALRDDDGA